MDQKTTTILYNCKRCKIGRRVDYPERGNGRAYRKAADGKSYMAGVWINSVRDGVVTYGGDPAGVCPTCNGAMTYDVIRGRLSADVPCDARCTGARGPSCDCSCGGQNHGAGWGFAA